MYNYNADINGEPIDNGIEKTNKRSTRIKDAETKNRIRMAVFDYLCKYTGEHGVPPSVRDICSELSLSSTATAFNYINELIEMGYLEKMPSKNRSYKIKGNSYRYGMSKIPVLGRVSAGLPILAVENVEDYVELPSEMFGEKDIFMLNVQGDSMIMAGINNGDRIVVRINPSPENNDIVVALIEGSEVTVKRFIKESKRIVLHPENPAYSDIIIDKSQEISILGVVIGLFRVF
ncbi:MAG: transcriptional repressor LexA [Clostridia bacterium]|nr:transcriptional repressor LexA [Clostridia bacterium]